MRVVAVVTAILGCMGLAPIARGGYSTLDVPGSTETTLLGVSSNRIVGIYRIGDGNWTGAVYDGTSWTTLNPVRCTRCRTACPVM